APRLPGGDVHVLDVTDLSHRGDARFVDAADFPGGEFHERIAAFAVAQDGLLPGAAGDLAATARDQLDVVNRGAERDLAQREGVADFGSGVLAGADLRADLEADRGEDVRLLAVGV